MRRLTLLGLLVLTSLGLRCAQNSQKAALDEPATPRGTLERQPYLVTVTDSSAVVRWRTIAPDQPGIRFWADGDTVTGKVAETGRDQTFEMLHLDPATKYTYQIQLGDTLWSDAVEFETFPEPGSRDAFTFLVLGDSGTHNESQLALARPLNEEKAAFMIHVGDLAYTDGTDRQFTDNYFDVYAPLLKRTPVFPSPGDHDLRTQGGKPYIDALTPPGGRNSGSPLYYSFTYGNARFISLFSKPEGEKTTAEGGLMTDPSSEQYQWLLRQLSAARNDPDIDWIFVFFHHPPYSASTGFGGHGSDLTIRRTISPLMDGYRVPFVFNGHDHDYQRSKPIRGNQVVDDGEGTVYLVSGGGGGRWTFRGTGADWFSAFTQQIHEFVRIKIDHYSLSLEAVNDRGDVFDSYEMSIPDEYRKPAVDEREAAPLSLQPTVEGRSEAAPDSAATPSATTGGSNPR